MYVCEGAATVFSIVLHNETLAEKFESDENLFELDIRHNRLSWNSH